MRQEAAMVLMAALRREDVWHDVSVYCVDGNWLYTVKPRAGDVDLARLVAACHAAGCIVHHSPTGGYYIRHSGDDL